MKTLNIDISNSDIGSYVLDATLSNVQFVFSGLPDAWSGAIKYASFIQDAKNILVEVIDNAAAVPVEILADSTDFYVGINAVEYGTGKLVGYSMPVLVTIKVPESKGTDVQKLIQLILKIGGIEDRLSDVATSGDYNDLLNKPVIDTIMNAESSNAVSNGTITKFIDDTVAKFTNGDITVDKASRDELGNYFQTTYATKEEFLNNIETVSIASITNHSFTNSTELDSLNYNKIYKLEHDSYVGWLFVSISDTNPPVTQRLIDMDGMIFYREYRETEGYAWSEWMQDYKDYTDSLERALENGLITVRKAKADINGNPIDTTYATKTSVIPKISLWQPNTSYEVGNVVLALDPDGYHYTAVCVSEHISSDRKSLFYNDSDYWTTLQLKVYKSESAIFANDAGHASCDYYGNNISDTYATKTELRPTPITSTATAITANNSYNYGEQTELSIAFPTTANDGDVVYITFKSGATATVLTLDTTNTSDIELIPEANTGYEVYAKYNGTIWIVNYSDYTVTAEAGA